MPAILLAVEHIVNQIDGAGQGAEDDKGGRRTKDGVAIGEALGEDESREDEEVLRPLAWAEREKEMD
jgi:hypothetical protein